MAIDQMVSINLIPIPAQYQKLFPQGIFDEKRLLSVAIYLDEGRAKPFDMIFSPNLLLLNQQGVLPSIHSQAKEPAPDVSDKKKFLFYLDEN